MLPRPRQGRCQERSHGTGFVSFGLSLRLGWPGIISCSHSALRWPLQGWEPCAEGQTRITVLEPGMSPCVCCSDILEQDAAHTTAPMRSPSPRRPCISALGFARRAKVALKCPWLCVCHLGPNSPHTLHREHTWAVSLGGFSYNCSCSYSSFCSASTLPSTGTSFY